MTVLGLGALLISVAVIDILGAVLLLCLEDRCSQLSRPHVFRMY